jgi:hypothetical protein
MNVAITAWGLLAIVAGIFICVYGHLLFRTVLAGAGLITGLYIGRWLTVGQDEFLRLVVSLLFAGGFAFALSRLYYVGFYVAGALGGAIVGFIIVALFGLDNSLLIPVVAIAAVVGGVIARFLGELAVIGGTSLLGTYSVLYGMSILFPGTLAQDGSPYIAMTSFNLALLAAIVAVAALAQYQMLRLRRRAPL